jgi:hypothetical protein
MDVSQAGGPKPAGEVRSRARSTMNTRPPRGFRTRTSSRRTWSRCSRPGMLWITRLEFTTSNVASGEWQVAGVGIVYVDAAGHTGSARVGDGPRGVLCHWSSRLRRRCRRRSRWSGVEPPRRGRARGRTRCREPFPHPATGWRQACAERRGPCRRCCPISGRRRRRRERARATARAEPLSPHPDSNQAGNAGRHQGAWGVESIPESVAAVWARGP